MHDTHLPNKESTKIRYLTPYATPQVFPLQLDPGHDPGYATEPVRSVF